MASPFKSAWTSVVGGTAKRLVAPQQQAMPAINQRTETSSSPPASPSKLMATRQFFEPSLYSDDDNIEQAGSRLLTSARGMPPQSQYGAATPLDDSIFEQQEEVEEGSSPGISSADEGEMIPFYEDYYSNAEDYSSSSSEGIDEDEEAQMNPYHISIPGLSRRALKSKSSQRPMQTLRGRVMLSSAIQSVVKPKPRASQQQASSSYESFNSSGRGVPSNLQQLYSSPSSSPSKHSSGIPIVLNNRRLQMSRLQLAYLMRRFRPASSEEYSRAMHNPKVETLRVANKYYIHNIRR